MALYKSLQYEYVIFAGSIKDQETLQDIKDLVEETKKPVLVKFLGEETIFEVKPEDSLYMIGRRHFAAVKANTDRRILADRRSSDEKVEVDRRIENRRRENLEKNQDLDPVDPKPDSE